MKRRYFLLYGGPIGDSLVAIHVGRTLAANVPGAVLEIVSTRENTFVRELCHDLPFIRYRSLRKESIGSWLMLPVFACTRYSSIAYEPVSSTMSLWWNIILWCVRRRAGGVQIFFQTHGYERSVPRDVVQCVYDCETTSLFDTPKTILEAWGIQTRILPRQSLPRQPVPPGKPYLLFHFFAGQVRRSIPIDHARAILEAARIAYPQHTFVITCAQNERERAELMVAGISGVRIESGHTAHELVSLLCGADLIVGTTSGVVLTAACLQLPLVALHCMSHKKGFLPDFSPKTTILAALDECRCRPGDGSACQLMTSEGPVYRCLYFITTEEVLSAMEEHLPKDK